jgi:hypothetical protein
MAKMLRLADSHGSTDITLGGVEFENVRVRVNGKQLEIKAIVPEQGQYTTMPSDFEKAAIAVARLRGFDTVTIDVGAVQSVEFSWNLSSRGYVPTGTRARYWIRTIQIIP